MKRIVTILMLMASVVLLCACSSGTERRVNEASTFALEQFMQDDYEDYIANLRRITGLNDLEATASIDTVHIPTAYDEKTNTLNLHCSLRFTSDDIEKYYTTDYNESSSDALVSVLKKLYNSYAKGKEFTYSYENATLILKVVNPSMNITVKTSNGRVYSYSGSGNYDTVKIDDDYVYMQEVGGTSSSKTDNKDSYSGSYDAKLVYGSEPVLIFVSEDAMDRYMDALVKGHEGTLDEMVLNGEVSTTERGTKCNIVKEKLTRAQVTLLEGSNKGSTVWVVIEAIQKK